MRTIPLLVLVALAGWDGGSLFEIHDPAQRDYVRLGIVEESGGAHFEIFYTASSNDALFDGDLYDVTLTTSDGATPIAVHHTARYMRNPPNGPTCYNDGVQQ
jgi:hypothetical protein